MSYIFYVSKPHPFSKNMDFSKNTDFQKPRLFKKTPNFPKTLPSVQKSRVFSMVFSYF